MHKMFKGISAALRKAISREHKVRIQQLPDWNLHPQVEESFRTALNAGPKRAHRSIFPKTSKGGRWWPRLAHGPQVKALPKKSALAKAQLTARPSRARRGVPGALGAGNPFEQALAFEDGSAYVRRHETLYRVQRAA